VARNKPVARNRRRPVRRRRRTTRKRRRNVARNQVKRYTLSKGYAANPRRRKRRTTRRRRRNVSRNRGYRRNQVYRYKIAPVAANPFARNAGLSGVMDMVKGTALSPSWLLENVAPVGAGFFASKLGAYQIVKLLAGDDVDKKDKFWGTNWKKALWQGGVGLAGMAGIGMATRSKAGINFGTKFLMGSLLCSFLTMLEGWDVYQEAAGLGDLTLGADVSSELKRKIADSIKEEIEAAEGVMGDFVTADNLPTSEYSGVGDFVTAEEIPDAMAGMALSDW
jgi:hypothetical protein